MTSRQFNNSLSKDKTPDSAKKKPSKESGSKNFSSRGDSIIDEVEANIANRWGLGISKSVSDNGKEEHKYGGYQVTGYELME